MPGDEVMMQRSLQSTSVESGSSFRMTQLLLPTADTTVHDSVTDGRSHPGADHLLPQLDTSAPPDHAAPRQYRSPRDYRDTSWQTSIKLDTSDHQRLSQRYCSSVYRNASGQSL